MYDTFKVLEARFNMSQNEFMVRMTLLALVETLLVMTLELLLVSSYLKGDARNLSPASFVCDKKIVGILKGLVTVAFASLMLFLFVVFSLAFTNI